MTGLKELEELFVKWDDYYPEPHPFHRFSKGLLNLVSFAIETLQAYEVHKQNAISQVNEENERIQKEGKNYSYVTILPEIVDKYFIRRLFKLCYLGAWASLETYLRDVAWLVLAKDLSTDKIVNSANMKKTVMHNSQLAVAAELVRSLRDFGDILKLYRRVLNINLTKLAPSKFLIAARKIRNKLAHSGCLLGYHSYLQQDDEWMRKKYRAKNHEDLVSEEFLCETLVQMWQLGDFLRRQSFENRYLDEIT